MYQLRKVDVNAVKSVLADVSIVSPSSEQASANTLFTAFSISTSTLR